MSASVDAELSIIIGGSDEMCFKTPRMLRLRVDPPEFQAMLIALVFNAAAPLSGSVNEIPR